MVCQVGEETDRLDDEQLVPREPPRILRDKARLCREKVPSETADGGAQGVEGAAHAPGGRGDGSFQGRTTLRRGHEEEMTYKRRLKVFECASEEHLR